MIPNFPQTEKQAKPLLSPVFLFTVSGCESDPKSAGLQEFDDISNRQKTVQIFVINGQIKLILTDHDEVGKLDGIDAKIGRKLSLGGNGGRIDLQLIHENIFYSLEHK